MNAPSALDEVGRLAALHAYDILDTPRECQFDALVSIAAHAFNVPIVLLTFIDEHRLWFKSTFGCITAGSETSRNTSFCAFTILCPGQIMVVEDATKDPRFLDNPSVTGNLGLRFYAGASIKSIDGYALGTICILDTVTRSMSSRELDALGALATTVACMMELGRSHAKLVESQAHYRHRMELSPHIAWTAGPDGLLLEIGPQIAVLIGQRVEQVEGRGWVEIVHPEDQPGFRHHWSEALRLGKVFDHEQRVRTVDGSHRWFRVYAAPRRNADKEIIRWYGIAEDINERRVIQGKFQHLAYHDGLTGLMNRIRFRELLEGQISIGAGDKPFALLCLDMDSFKAVNDTLGHLAGDSLLQKVADRLRRCVRSTDILSRIGGDEFFIVQTDLEKPEDAAALAERILAVLAESLALENHLLSPTASIGITLYPQDGVDPDKLLQSADLALYRAKEEGRGTYRFFQPEMDEKLRRHQALKIDLQGALERGEFTLVYQPLVGMQSGRLEGFEALLRWNHANHGSISPNDFIPAAESTGLIIAIGRWVLEQACHQATLLPEDLTIAVNLSAVQFGQRDLPQAVFSALKSSNLAPGRLELEITESVPILNNDQNLSILTQLREIGIGIVLDDFGTGYASLSYLQRFPFDKLKIDRSFVEQLDVAEGARAIVKAILDMSRALGVSTTAEGIETSEQFRYLREEGCDQGQGYLFSYPISAEDIPAFISGNMISQDLQLKPG